MRVHAHTSTSMHVLTHTDRYVGSFLTCRCLRACVAVRRFRGSGSRRARMKLRAREEGLTWLERKLHTTQRQRANHTVVNAAMRETTHLALSIAAKYSCQAPLGNSQDLSRTLIPSTPAAGIHTDRSKVYRRLHTLPVNNEMKETTGTRR